MKLTFSVAFILPQNKEIAFEYVNGEVKFTVPEVDIHAMVVIEWSFYQ